MDRQELSDYIDNLAEEVEDIEKYLIDITLAAKGALQYAEIMCMSSTKVNLFVERIEAKIKAETGVKGKEYL
jgi:hypothetical protein